MTSPVAVYVDTTGIHAPTYADILTYLQAQYQAIFGADVYLGSDSQDGQFLGIIAAALNDANAGAVAVYNSFSPATGQGNGLSSNVKLNGIKRLVPTNSTVDLTLTGVANTLIVNGIVSDANKVKWNLPVNVTIPSGGEITVTATCQELGAVAAAAGSVTKIETPAQGWQSVTNDAAAVLGQPVETDAQLRVRQGKSVAVPSQSIFEGIVGSVANIAGVTRIVGYENDTDTTDANGIPGHTIAVVVEGGDVATIQQTIANKKTPGTGTFGNIVAFVTDSVGSSHLIKFSRPTESTVKIYLTVEALTGYSAAIEPYIKQSLVDFIQSLQIGAKVIYSKLFVPANLDNQGYGLTYNIQSMTIAKGAGTPAAADIVMAFNEVATATLADVTITVV